MNPNTELIGLSAAFLVGLIGGTHCFGMCGGIAGALGVRSRALNGGTALYRHAMLYQLGRVAGYVLLGTVAGAFGRVLDTLLDFASAAVALRIASGVILLLIAVRMVLRWNALAALERFGARVWQGLQPLRSRVAGTQPIHSLLLGLFWGFLPCGMVYSMLAFAALSGSALHGAALLLVFGLGTVPSMFGGTLMAAKSVKLLSSRLAQRATAFLLALFGVWMVVAPILETGHHVH